MSGRSDRSRRLLAILVGGSLLATLGAAPGRAGEAARTGDAVTAFGAEPETTTVTLVTGDRVHVQRGADGREGITVDPAPRPGGVVPQFHASSRDGVTRVVPSDVAALVPDRLDPALFDVTALAAQDAGTTLPLILDYADDAVRPLDTTPAPGTTATLQLSSVNAVAVDADPEEFGAAVLALPGARPLAGGDPLGAVEKVWLDARTQARLDRSTGQISAPAAWDAGVEGDGVTVAVLDSGIDDTHPDLAGRVDAAVNFTDDPDAGDDAGHGTHVASILAGTGAASDGARRGVAPGARLLSGKVLDHQASGYVSWAIAGMEWAAGQGAQIVNMSLGLGPGDFEAPLLTGAVERLSAEHGTLFVVAAGNNGCDACVSSPADAPSALTVGAVDRDDRLADFSSRGPAYEGYQLKPEVTAPGVQISAARAGGGDPYVAYSGTSMAAPHVAGAAALLAQARPDLTGPELRSALTSTAVPADGVAVTGQGSGRIDVGRALASPVLASGGDLSFGLVPFPGDLPAQPLRRSVEYRNTTAAPVTVELAVDVPGAAAGDLTVTPSSLTLAPGATGSAEVALDVAGGRPGDYAGYLLATPAGEPDPLRLPLGYTVEAEHFDLTVTAIAADGRPAEPQITGFVASPVIDVRTGEPILRGSCPDGSEPAWCAQVPAGTYSVMTWVVTKPAWADSDGDPYTTTPLHSALVGDPEVTITGDTALVMDAREAVEVRVATPDHETRANLGGAVGFGWARTPADGPATVDFVLNPPGAQLEERVFLQPTDEVTIGSFTASSRFRLAAPDLTLDVDGVALEPSYYAPAQLSDVISQFPMLDGELTLPVVDAGEGTAADVAAADLDGALALVRRSDAVSVAVQANRAAAAGAALVAVYNDVPGSNDEVGPEVVQLEVPTVRLSHEEGRALLERLADGAVTATATGTPSSPYVYDLVHLERGRIPAELSYVARAADLAAVRHDFGVQVSGSLTEVSYPFDADHAFSVSLLVPVPQAPVSRTNYYIDDPTTLWQHAVRTPETPYGGRWPAPTVVDLTLLGPLRPAVDGERSWLRQPLVPGFDPERPMTRRGDQLIIPTAGYVDDAGNFGEAWADGFGAGYRPLFQVWHGDELLGEASGIELPSGTIALPPGEETYRIDYSIENRTPWAALSTRTRTSWTFVSGTTPVDDDPAVVPLLTLDHDLGADLTNRLPAPRDRRGPNEISVEAGHLAGADPRVTGVTVEASYDDGATWRPLRVRRSGDTFTAHLPNRPPRGHAGFVSLRFGAADAAGNRIDQEIIRAAALPAD